MHLRALLFFLVVRCAFWTDDAACNPIQKQVWITVFFILSCKQVWIIVLIVSCKQVWVIVLIVRCKKVCESAQAGDSQEEAEGYELQDPIQAWLVPSRRTPPPALAEPRHPNKV